MKALAAGCLLTALAAAPAAGVDFRVASRLEPTAVGLDGFVYYTIEVEGSGLEQPRLAPRFELENLEVVGGPDVTHGITLGTGGGGWRYSWTWRLRPLAAGRAGVRDVHLLVGEREVELAPRHLEVLEQAPLGAAPPPPGEASPFPEPGRRSRLEELLSRGLGRGRPGEPPGGAPRAHEPALFLRAVAAPDRPYVGQRVVYTVYLYTQAPVRAMEIESLPRFEGLWARPVDLEQASVERVEWEGQPYFRKAILQKQLYALAADTHVLEPVRIRLLTERIERGRFFLAPERVPVQTERESNPVEIEVLPLPGHAAGRAAPALGTGCAVGRLELEAVLDRRELGVGEGATLTVSAAGEGHLEALRAPPFRAPEGVDVLGPDPAAPAGGEEGAAQRSWSYLLVPRRPGSWRLPAVELPWFDPASGEYRLARATVPDLVARGPAAAEAEVSAATTPGIASPGSATPGSDRLKNPLEAWGLLGGWRAALVWGLAVPTLAALVLVLSRQRGGRRTPPGAGADLRELRRRLDDAVREERPRRAAAAIERAWRHFLTTARGLPAGVPPAAWPDELLDRGARREACRELRRLLEDLHYLRFAPELSATAALAADLVRRSERVARDLVS